MILGISSLIFNIENSLEMCKELDKIKHIEIGIDNLDECKILNEYKDTFIDMGISIGIHLPMELNTCENIEYIRNSWLQFINIIDDELKELDIKYFNLHLGYVIDSRLSNNRTKYLDISTSFLKNLISSTNKDVCLENVYSNKGDISNVGNNLHDFEYIFNIIKDDKLCFCYDTGHNLINEDKYIYRIADKIKVVHLSDNNGKNDLHIGIGKGILSNKEINKIININPKYLILEINHLDIKESLKKLEAIIKDK